MKVRIKADGSFDAARLAARVEKAIRNNITYAAGYVRKAAYRSIRISRNPSRPGKPIHSRAGVLKHAVKYRVDHARRTAWVGIGPDVGNPPRRSEIAGLHEHGGVANFPGVKYQSGWLGPVREAREGEAGAWVRQSGWLKGYIVARLKTPAQVSRANAIAASLRPPARLAYPARPFVRPALEKCWPRILKRFSL